MSDIDDMIDRLTDRQRSEFALACARRTKRHLMREPRSIAALDAPERWLRGEATIEEMAGAARMAAAERAAGSASGWDAWAAWAAARDAESAWQREELERMLKEGGGA